MLLAMTEYKLERKCEARGFIIKLGIFLKKKKTIILSKPTTYLGMYSRQTCKMNFHLIRQIDKRKIKYMIKIRSCYNEIYFIKTKYKNEI